MNKPQLPEMSLEHNPQPADVSPKLADVSLTRLLVARLLVMLLLGMIFAALFGDFVVWAVYGTRFILSPRFHKLEPILLGFSVLLIYSFMWQGLALWKQRKYHFALLGFVALAVGGVSCAPICAIVIRLVAAKGAATLAHPKAISLAMLMLLILACKCSAAMSIWQLTRPIFREQDQRRVVISK